jgi:glutathione S-transferase
MTNFGRPLLVIGNRNYSSWSLRAWLFLKHHGVEFDERRLALDTPAFDATISDWSPTRRVPVLLHGPVTIWDSLAICEYGAEVLAGVPGWPDAVEARAMARSVACEMHSGFDALRSELPMNCRARDRRVSLSEAGQRDVLRVAEIFDAAATAGGASGPWMFGRFCIADAMYAPVASRFLTYGIQPPGAAGPWMDSILTHPGMRAWMVTAHEEPEIIEADEAGGT